MKTQKKFLILPVICFTMLLALAEAARAVEYEYTELLPPGWAHAGGISSGGKPFNHNINDNGDVVFSGYQTEFVGDQIRGVIYSEGEYTELLPPGWVNSKAHGVNNQGEVFGDGLEDAQGYSRGFIYNKDTKTYTEVLPSEWFNATVTGINNKGVVLGWGRKEDIDDRERAFVYKNGYYMPLRSPLFLPIPGVASETVFNDINDYGAIVGNYSLCFGCIGWGWGWEIRFGFVYRGGIYNWLLPHPDFFFEDAIALNNRGEVLGGGYGNADGTDPKSFIYRGGIYTFLKPPGWFWATASDINDRGEVVGTGFDGTTHECSDDGRDKVSDCPTHKVFVYSKGTYTELLPPGWIDSYGTAINNNGAVVGGGTDGNQIGKMFIAIPQND